MQSKIRVLCLMTWLFNRQVVDCLADGMAFGALEACKECKGQLVFKGDAYYCKGDISAWTKCVFKTATPVRKDWVIPKVGHLIAETSLPALIGVSLQWVLWLTMCSDHPVEGS